MRDARDARDVRDERDDACDARDGAREGLVLFVMYNLLAVVIIPNAIMSWKDDRGVMADCFQEFGDDCPKKEKYGKGLGDDNDD